MKDVKTIRAEKPEGQGVVGTLEEIVRRGAQRFLEVALNEEVAIFCERHAARVDEHGHRLIVRNGKQNRRILVTGAGPLEMTVTYHLP